MRQLLIKPDIYLYDTCTAFGEAFEVGEGDLIITNEYIYQPMFGALGIKADVLYQEKYGMGEPSAPVGARRLAAAAVAETHGAHQNG